MAAPQTTYAVNPGPAADFMQWILTQRGHIAILGNSNEFFNTGGAAGRVQGLYKQCAAAGIPIYATPAMTLCGIDPTTGVPAASSGFITQSYPDIARYSLGTAAGNYFDPAPNGATGLVRDPFNASYSAWEPLGRVHRWGRPETAAASYSTLLGLLCMTGCTGTTPLPNANNGIYSISLSPSDPNVMQWTQKIRGEFWMANTTPGGGTARPAISVNNALAVQTPAITVASGTPTPRNMQRYVTSDLAAGARAGTVRCGFTVPNGTVLTGDVALSYLFVVHPDRTTGLSFGSPWSVGGASPFDVAFSHYGAARATSDEAIYHYLQATCQMQADKDQDPCFCLVIADTLNMRNEATTTAWQTSVVADSPEAYARAIAYVIARWQAMWNTLELVGSDGSTVIRTKADRFKVIIGLDHPTGDPDDAEQIAYREQGGQILAARFPDTVTALRMDRIISAAELYAVNTNQGYYSNTTRTISAISAATYPEVTTTASHGLVVGQYVTHSSTNSTPPIDGACRVRSIVSSTKYTIDAPATTGAGSSGTVTIRDTNHLTEAGYTHYGQKFWAAMAAIRAYAVSRSRLIRSRR